MRGVMAGVWLACGLGRIWLNTECVASCTQMSSFLGESMTTDRDYYQEKQKNHYHFCITTGRTQSAYDALWRAASAANLLEYWEVSSEGFSDERVQQLVQQLGWA